MSWHSKRNIRRTKSMPWHPTLMHTDMALDPKTSRDQRLLLLLLLSLRLLRQI
jgi:hypothetical protein